MKFLSVTHPGEHYIISLQIDYVFWEVLKGVAFLGIKMQKMAYIQKIL